MKRLIVGGTFDEDSGKPSYIISQLAMYLGSNYQCVNGGNLEFIRNFRPDGLQVLIWMPNISNDEDKTLSRLKPMNPEMILIQSKRVIEKEYFESDVIGRMLKSHSLLGIMISKDKYYNYKLLDPLGNLWCSTDKIETLAHTLNDRLNYLLSLTRVRSESVDQTDMTEVPEEFIKLIQRFGDKFTKFVNAVNPNRLLGNASTRCTKGFPAIRLQDSIMVTRRNVDKTSLTKDDFVKAKNGTNNKIQYQGLNKPSVDTPIQLKLFDYYTNVDYIIHGHVYVQDGIFTHDKIPCGYLEEFDEINRLIPDSTATNFVINLRGHGCLILSKDLDHMDSQIDKLYGRPMPEE